MSQVNSLSGSILQSSQVQQSQAVEKNRQLRRQNNQSRNIALRDDELEHQVESAEQLKPVQEDHEPPADGRKRQQHPKRQGTEAGEPDVPHIDLTA